MAYRRKKHERDRKNIQINRRKRIRRKAVRVLARAGITLKNPSDLRWENGVLHFYNDKGQRAQMATEAAGVTHEGSLEFKKWPPARAYTPPPPPRNPDLPRSSGITGWW